MVESAPRLEVHRYGALAADAALATKLGLTAAQRASLLAHPDVKPADPAVVALVRDDAVQARIGLFPGRIRIDGQEFPIGWGTNWSVAPGVKVGSGAGLLLLRAIREAGSFGGWGISQVAFPIYEAAKFDTSVLERRMVVLRSRPVLRKRLGHDGLARLASVPVDLALGAASRALSLRLPRGEFTLDHVARFDESVERLDLESRTGVWFPRGHRELNWALAHPWLGEAERYRSFALVQRSRSGEVTGYAIARSRFYGVASSAGYRDLTLGSLLRFTASPRHPGALASLLRGVVDVLSSHGVDAIEICTRDRFLLELSDRLGALRVGELRVGLKLAGAQRTAFLARRRSLDDACADLGEGDVIFS